MAAQPNSTDPPDIRDILAKLSGCPLEEFTCRWKNGLTLSYRQPEPVETPTKPEPIQSLTPTESVMADTVVRMLNDCLTPVKRDTLFEFFQPKTKGGPLGRVIKNLVQTGRIYRRDALHTTDPNKFEMVDDDDE